MDDTQTYTVTFEEGNTQFATTIHKLDPKTFLPLMMSRPDGLKGEPSVDQIPSEDAVTWLQMFINEATALPMSTIRALSISTVLDLGIDCIRVSGGQEPIKLSSTTNETESSFKVGGGRAHQEFNELDLNDDGTIDLEDMQ